VLECEDAATAQDYEHDSNGRSQFFGASASPLGGLELVQCKSFVVDGDPGSGCMPVGPTSVIPPDESVVTVGDAPVVETGDDGTSVVTVGAGLIVATGDDGTGVRLSPPSPIWTAPNGIPLRETPLGDEGDITVDDDAAPLVPVLHVPDVGALPGNGASVPTVNPPPSKLVPSPQRPLTDFPWRISCPCLSSRLRQSAPG